MIIWSALGSAVRLQKHKNINIDMHYKLIIQEKEKLLLTKALMDSNQHVSLFLC